MNTRNQVGFTIVELLIVIVVIAILAAITVVAYNGIRDRAQLSRASASLDQARKKVRLYYVENTSYPATMAAAGVQDGNDSTYSFVSSGSSYCIAIASFGKSYSVRGDSGAVIQSGCTAGTTNLALNASVTSSPTGSYGGRPPSRVSDGDTNTGNFFEADVGTQYAQIDLGSVQLVGQVIVWHYYGDGRSYNNNVIQISTDGSSWTTLFNSTVNGPFTEIPSGHSITFPLTQVRYIRDSINGSSSNPGNHWVEIQAY